MTSQSSPALPEPRQLAGEWLISAGGAGVALVLTARPADPPTAGAPAWGLQAEAAELQTLGLGAVAAWRPATDGIALIGADGLTAAFFSAEASGRYVNRARGGILTLRRRTP